MSNRKREHSIMLPNATSTPLSVYSKRALTNQDKGPNLSPIVERSASIISRQATSLAGQTSYHHFTKFSESLKFNSGKYAPLVVMNSESDDSEDDNEIASLTSRRINRRRRVVKTVTLKGGKSIQIKTDPMQFSQVEANSNFDELKIKSYTNFKPKGDNSLNVVFKQIEKNRDIKLEPLSRVQNRKTSQSKSNLEERKENIVRKINEVDLLLVKKNIKVPERKGLAPIAQNMIDNCAPSTALLGAETVESHFPEFCSPESFQWMESKQEGISTFTFLSIVYVKIKPKHKLTKNTLFLNVKIFIIIEGNAVVALNSKSVKVGPGAALKLTSDWSVKNNGVTKSLILVCVKE